MAFERRNESEYDGVWDTRQEAGQPLVPQRKQHPSPGSEIVYKEDVQYTSGPVLNEKDRSDGWGYRAPLFADEPEDSEIILPDAGVDAARPQDFNSQEEYRGDSVPEMQVQTAAPVQDRTPVFMEAEDTVDPRFEAIMRGVVLSTLFQTDTTSRALVPIGNNQMLKMAENMMEPEEFLVTLNPQQETAAEQETAAHAQPETTVQTEAPVHTARVAAYTRIPKENVTDNADRNNKTHVVHDTAGSSQRETVRTRQWGEIPSRTSAESRVRTAKHKATVSREKAAAPAKHTVRQEQKTYSPPFFARLAKFLWSKFRQASIESEINYYLSHEPLYAGAAETSYITVPRTHAVSRPDLRRKKQTHTLQELKQPLVQKQVLHTGEQQPLQDQVQHVAMRNIAYTGTTAQAEQQRQTGNRQQPQYGTVPLEYTRISAQEPVRRVQGDVLKPEEPRVLHPNDNTYKESPVIEVPYRVVEVQEQTPLIAPTLLLEENKPLQLMGAGFNELILNGELAQLRETRQKEKPHVLLPSDANKTIEGEFRVLTPDHPDGLHNPEPDAAQDAVQQDENMQFVSADLPQEAANAEVVETFAAPEQITELLEENVPDEQPETHVEVTPGEEIHFEQPSNGEVDSYIAEPLTDSGVYAGPATIETELPQAIDVHVSEILQQQKLPMIPAMPATVDSPQ